VAAALVTVGCGADGNDRPLDSLLGPGRVVRLVDVSGRVVSTRGGGVAGARVSTRNAATATDADGAFRLTFDRLTSNGVITVTADGFEPEQWQVNVALTVTHPEIRLQPIVALGRGTTMVELDTAGIGRYIGEPYDSPYCGTCLIVRLADAAAGAGRVEVRWTGPAELGLWHGNSLTAADIVAPGHVVLTRFGGADGPLYVGPPWNASPLERPVLLTFRVE